MEAVIYTGPIFETEQILWPAHCIQNTTDAELHKDLIVNALEYNVTHVNKGLNSDIDSYSAFWDNNKNQTTELDEMLKKWGITHVFVVGLATDVCVAATAFDAKDLSYTTYVIEDACRGVNETTINEKIEGMRQLGISIIQSSEVKGLINSANYKQIHFILIIFFFFSSLIYE
jgi:nicotinamidase/pyrazinamidase